VKTRYKDIKDKSIIAHYTKNDSYALEEVLKERMVTQHKNKRLALRRGKQGLTRARAFCFKNRGKNVLRGVC
jgi:hypothetical protein